MSSKKIATLIPDIYKLLGDSNAKLWIDPDRLTELATKMANHVRDEIIDPDRSDRDPKVF